MLEEKAGEIITLDRLFVKAHSHNKGNNRGATVLVHVAKNSKMLEVCRGSLSAKLPMSSTTAMAIFTPVERFNSDPQENRA